VGVFFEPAARRVFCCRPDGAAVFSSPNHRFLRNGGVARFDKPSGATPSRSPHQCCCVRRIGRVHTELHRAGVGMTIATTHKIIDLDRARSGDRSARKSHLARSYCSILFERADDRVLHEGLEPPAFFVDLNCNQIVDALTTGREEYNLKPFFHACLRRVDAVKYRHEVMQDLENATLLEQVRLFARKMHEMRDDLARAQKLYSKEQKHSWLLDAIELYCDTINSFVAGLSEAELKSRGFLGFRDYLKSYVDSSPFTTLLLETKRLKAELATVQYCVLIRGDKFTVRKYEAETDYSVDVEQTFEKFKQGAVKDYRFKFSETDDMNGVEAKILEFVARLHPEIFVALDEYCAKNANYLNETAAAFDREIQFYLAYLDYTTDLKRAGLRFCYPRMSDKSKEVYDYDGFDIALAHKLAKQNAKVVCNDFQLKGKERILVVSGPNQGGKTTFARAFGQLHYLASIGCQVPGREAQLFLFDKMFTHFEKEEKVENLRGKLEDDLVRIRQILSQATPRSILIMNEIFTSTTIQDETFLSKKVMETISAIDVLSVWVTFVDELASFGPQTVSMLSTVVPDNPALRTFKIERLPADGLAHAMAIVQKYGLTFDSINDRIKS
jgi:DNA mismatch repair protein MutS